MIGRSMKMFSAGLICLAVASITMASCDSNSTNPSDPTGKGKGKGPAVLSDDCITTVQVNRCAIGGAQLQRSEFDPSVVVATGFNEEGSSGISSSFEPGSHWSQQIADVQFPAQGGNLLYTSSEAGSVQSTLNIAQDAANPDLLNLNPTFSGGDDDDVSYDLQVWNNATLVAERRAIPFTVTTTVRNSACCSLLGSLAFHVMQHGQCAWHVSTRDHIYNVLRPACCSLTVTLQGEIFGGNQVRIIERNKSGNYPYHTSDQVNVTGRVESYAIRSEAAGS